MRVVIFFACLCFLLLRGDKCAFSFTPHHNICNNPTQHLNSQWLVKVTDTNQDDTITSDTDLEEEAEYLVSDDVEDDDASNFLVRKYRLLARCDLSHAHLSTLSYLRKYFQAPPPFWGHLSNIYLTQGALRI